MIRPTTLAAVVVFACWPSFASNIKSPSRISTEAKDVVVWEFGGSTTQTTSASDLTLNEWNGFRYLGDKHTEPQDLHAEWAHSVSLGDYPELCFYPRFNDTRKFHIRAWFSFLQDISGTNQVVKMAIGYSPDGEGVVHGDVTGDYYQQTGMTDNTRTTVSVEQTMSIANAGCIRPMVQLDTTVDLLVSSGQIVITELAE